MREKSSEGTNEADDDPSGSERVSFDPGSWLKRLRESKREEAERVPEGEVDNGRGGEPALESRVGVPRREIEPERYLDPGPEVQADLERSQTLAGYEDLPQWLDRINPRFESFPAGSAEAIPWQNNCGECSRCFADAYQGVEVRAAWGDGRCIDREPAPGEYDEMWEWAGGRPPQRLENMTHDRADEFTAHAWDATEKALRRLPPGTVAIVGVDWESPHALLPREEAGGHWFNAVVRIDGIQWVDAQSGETADWPPSYGGRIWGLEAIARRPGSSWEGVDVVRG